MLHHGERPKELIKKHTVLILPRLSQATSILEIRASVWVVVIAVATAAEPTIVRDTVPATVASIGQPAPIGGAPHDKLGVRHVRLVALGIKQRLEGRAAAVLVGIGVVGDASTVPLLLAQIGLAAHAGTLIVVHGGRRRPGTASQHGISPAIVLLAYITETARRPYSAAVGSAVGQLIRIGPTTVVPPIALPHHPPIESFLILAFIAEADRSSAPRHGGERIAPQVLRMLVAAAGEQGLEGAGPLFLAALVAARVVIHVGEVTVVVVVVGSVVAIHLAPIAEAASGSGRSQCHGPASVIAATLVIEKRFVGGTHGSASCRMCGVIGTNEKPSKQNKNAMRAMKKEKDTDANVMQFRFSSHKPHPEHVLYTCIWIEEFRAVETSPHCACTPKRWCFLLVANFHRCIFYHVEFFQHIHTMHAN